MSEVVYQFDGGGGGADGPCGWGWVRDDGSAGCGALPPGSTSNEAEYTALTMAVHDAHTLYANQGETEFVFLGDSKLVVEQVNGNWKVHANKLRPYVNNIQMLLEGLPAWRLAWIPRKKNGKADEMAWLGKGKWGNAPSLPEERNNIKQLRRGWDLP